MEPEYEPCEREKEFTVICTSRGVEPVLTSEDSHELPRSEVTTETVNGRPGTGDATVMVWLAGGAPPACPTKASAWGDATIDGNDASTTRIRLLPYSGINKLDALSSSLECHLENRGSCLYSIRHRPDHILDLRRWHVLRQPRCE